MKHILLCFALLCSFWSNAQFYKSSFGREVKLTNIQNNPYDFQHWGVYGGFFSAFGKQYGGIVYQHPTKMELELSLGSNSRLEGSYFIKSWESQVRKSRFIIGGKSRTHHKWDTTPGAPAGSTNHKTYQPVTVTIHETVDLPLYYLHSIGFHGGISHGNVDHEPDTFDDEITLNTTAIYLGVALQLAYSSFAILDDKEEVYNRWIMNYSVDYIRYFDTTIPDAADTPQEMIDEILDDLPNSGFRIMGKYSIWYNKKFFTTYRGGFMLPINNLAISKWIAGVGVGYAF